MNGNLRCPCKNQLNRPRSRQPGKYEEISYRGNHENDDANQYRINDVAKDDWRQQQKRYQE